MPVCKEKVEVAPVLSPGGLRSYRVAGTVPAPIPGVFVLSGKQRSYGDRECVRVRTKGLRNRQFCASVQGMTSAGDTPSPFFHNVFILKADRH